MNNTNKKRAMQSTDQSERITLESATEKISLLNKFTTKEPQLSTIEPYNTILSLIGIGEDNAVHLAYITKLTDIHERELRKYIEQLRRSGIVIISNNKGYFKPYTKAELQRYITQETRRAKSIFYTLKNARRLMKKAKGVM